jgi:preprotein translocase subunit YajC
MFITPALAQTTTAPGGSNIILQLMPFILIFAIMYFLIIRPQQKRLKAHREMVAGVKRGDTVVTAGGLVGKVVSVVDDDEIRVDIADGVRVSVVRNTLSEVRPKGEVRGQAKAEKQTEQIANDDEADADDAETATAAKSANGAAKKPAARKSRSAGASGGARKSGSSAASKAGSASKSGGAKSSGASSSGTSNRTRRSRAKTSGNGASANQNKDTSGDNA